MSKILLCAICLLLLFPILWMVAGSLQPAALIFRVPPSLPRMPTLANYQAFLSKAPVLRWAWNSFLLTTIILFCILLSSSLAAYVLTTLNFKGKRFLYWLLISGLMAPIPCLLVPRYIVSRYIGGINNWWGIIAMYIYAPGAIVLLRQCFTAIPRDFYDAARIDGARDFAILWHIVLPQSTAVLAYLALGQFLGALQDFAWPMLILNNRKLFTLPMGVLDFLRSYTSMYGGASGQTQLVGMELAGGTLLFLPALAIFVAFRNVLNKRFLEGGLKQ